MTISQMRKTLELTQKAFGEKYRIPLKTIQNWESDSSKSESRRCPVYLRILLAKAVAIDFDISLAERRTEQVLDAIGLKLEDRFRKALLFAANQIEQSEAFPYATDLILYGSLSRGEASEDSDIDLLMVLDDEFKTVADHDSIIRRLKGSISSDDYRDPEADLHVVYGQEWKDSGKAYFMNINKDGVSLWNLEPITTLQTTTTAS